MIGKYEMAQMSEHWPEAIAPVIWACHEAHVKGEFTSAYMVDIDDEQLMDGVQADLLWLSRKQWTVIDLGDNVLVIHWGPGWVAWGIASSVAEASLWYFIDESVRDLL